MPRSHHRRSLRRRPVLLPAAGVHLLPAGRHLGHRLLAGDPTYLFMNTLIHQNGRYRQRQYLQQTKTLHATYYVLLENTRKKMNKHKALKCPYTEQRSTFIVV